RFARQRRCPSASIRPSGWHAAASHTSPELIGPAAHGPLAGTCTPFRGHATGLLNELLRTSHKVTLELRPGVRLGLARQLVLVDVGRRRPFPLAAHSCAKCLN